MLTSDSYNVVVVRTADLGEERANLSAFRTFVRFVITKTSLYNFDPLKPHFYIVKLGFKGVYIIFLITASNIDCGTR